MDKLQDNISLFSLLGLSKITKLLYPISSTIKKVLSVDTNTLEIELLCTELKGIFLMIKYFENS